MSSNIYNDLLALSMANPQYNIFFDGIGKERINHNFPRGYKIKEVKLDDYVTTPDGCVYYASGDYGKFLKPVIIMQLTGVQCSTGFTNNELEMMWKGLLPWEKCIRIIVEKVYGTLE